MEALVAVFAEIILACMMPVIGLMSAVVGAVFEAILLLFGSVFAEYVDKRRKRRADAANRPVPPRKPLIPRKAIHWFAGICATVGVIGIVASHVFFQPILRYAMGFAGDKAGMTVQYTEARGSLLGGHVILEGVYLSRTHDTGLGFDLQIERAEADVSLFSLIVGPPVLKLGQVNGMTGTITPPLPNEEKKGLPRQRRPFRADLFAIENVNLQITPRGEEPYAVLIESAQVAPFRSGLAVFDLLFRSNMTAEIAEQPLIIETREISENGRETRWVFEDVDVRQLRRVLPKVPLLWVEKGQITVDVSDKWSLSEDFVDMDWRIAGTGLRTSVPDRAGPAERLVATGLQRYVDRFGGDVDFQYRLELDPDEMAQLREGDLDLFWDKVMSGIIKGGVSQREASSESEESDEDEQPGAIDRLRTLFGRGSNGD